MTPYTSAQCEDIIRQRRDVIASIWYQAIVKKDPVPSNQDDLKKRFIELVDQAISLLFIDPFDPKKAQNIGESLVELGLIQPYVLGRTQAILAYQTIEGLTPNQVVFMQPRTALLLSGVATGYFKRACERIRLEQDRINEGNSEIGNLTEKALEESEQKFRNIVESSPFGIHIYELDEGGKLVFTGANQEADRILKVDNTQFIGKSIEEAFPHLVDTEIPRRYRLAAAEGQAWQTDNIEYQGQKIKGAFEVHAFQTSPGKMVAMFLDITALKASEEDLRASQAIFQGMYENAPNAYFNVGTDSRIHRCNQRSSELLGLPIDEIVGRDVFDLYADTPQGKERAREIFQRFLDGEIIVDEELQMLKADGTPVWISLTVNAERDAFGQIIESRSMVVDISKRKQYERELQVLLAASDTLRTAISRSEAQTDALIQLEYLLNVTAARVEILDQDEDILVVEIARGSWANETGNRISSKEGIRGIILSTGEPYFSGQEQNVTFHVKDEIALDGEAYAGIPLVARDRSIGILWVSRERDFDRRESRFLTAIADMTANVIHRIIMYEMEHNQRLWSESLVEVAAALNRSLDPDVVINAILEQVLRVIPCQSSNVMLIDGEEVYITQFMGYERVGLIPETLSSIRLSLSLPVFEELMATGESIVISDVSQYDPWITIPGTEWIRSFASAALKVGEEVIGFINVDSEQVNFFDGDMTRRLETFADHAAVAIHKTQLNAEIKAALEQKGKDVPMVTLS